jgi:putative endonuclease
MASHSRVLYTGVTNNLCRRAYEHRHKIVEGFTKRYNVSRLVYYEETNDVNAAIAREKQVKRWRREKKIVLIESVNPAWLDLYEELCGKED